MVSTARQAAEILAAPVRCAAAECVEEVEDDDWFADTDQANIDKK